MLIKIIKCWEKRIMQNSDDSPRSSIIRHVKVQQKVKHHIRYEFSNQTHQEHSQPEPIADDTSQQHIRPTF